MQQIMSLLKEREKQLVQMKAEKEKALGKAPKGKLRVCSHGGKVQYYHRKDPKDFNGVYLREKDERLARKLAQKSYDEKVLAAAEKELNAIQKYFANCPEKKTEQIYEQLHKERKKLVLPIWEPDEVYVQKWETAEYQGKAFYDDVAELFTAKGERVRSKSELIIADLLKEEEVPYRYECPVYIKGMGMVYPDFTVLHVRKRKEIYWEHLGMMDDLAYVEYAMQKIAGYEQNDIFVGDKLILTYETRKKPLNVKSVKRLIQHYLK